MITLKAEREIAYDSPDHLQPWGTKRCNGSNPRFIAKICNLFEKQDVPKILDLGCAGGKMARDFIDAGCIAVGLEGSDYSKRHRRAEWAIIPDSLFTCDITKPFRLLDDGDELKFNIITAWEVVEHLATPDLDGLMVNLQQHLANGGLFILSTAATPDFVNGVNLHQTMQYKPWWIKKFEAAGFEHRPEYIKYFNTQWVRGKYETKDGFHIIFCRAGDNPPAPPHEGWKLRLYDRWVGTELQHFIAGDALAEAFLRV